MAKNCSGTDPEEHLDAKDIEITWTQSQNTAPRDSVLLKIMIGTHTTKPRSPYLVPEDSLMRHSGVVHVGLRGSIVGSPSTFE